MIEKHDPIRLPKIRKSAKGQRCTVLSPWCLHVTGEDRHQETTVLAHWAEPGEKGCGLKPDDTSAFYACFRCHNWIDGRWDPPPGEYPWANKLEYAFRAMRRTWRLLVVNGVLK